MTEHSAAQNADSAGPHDPASWDERYRQHTVWSGRPNPHLVTLASGRRPGRALDAGCGEGADAVWLAERGWRVTAVDFSAVAVERASARAAEAAVADRVTWLVADLSAWTPPAGAFDLVSAQFLHLAPERRSVVHQRLATAVAPDGVLLLVEHSAADLATTVGRPRDPALYSPAADVAGALATDDWELLAVERRARPATDADGRSVTVHDEVLVARRR